jgi:hypothetical protein
MGFEKHEEATPSPPFQDRRLQPLGHPTYGLLEMRLHEKGWTDEHLAKLFGGNLIRVFLGEKITKE